MLTKKYVRTIFVAPKLWILEQFSLNFQTIPRFKEIARIFKGRNDFSKTVVEGRQKYCVSLPTQDRDGTVINPRKGDRRRTNPGTDQ